MQQAIKNIFDLENAPFIDLKIKPTGYQKYIESKKIEQFKVDLHRVIDKINKKNNSQTLKKNLLKIKQCILTHDGTRERGTYNWIIYNNCHDYFYDNFNQKIDYSNELLMPADEGKNVTEDSCKLYIDLDIRKEDVQDQDLAELIVQQTLLLFIKIQYYYRYKQYCKNEIEIDAQTDEKNKKVMQLNDILEYIEGAKNFKKFLQDQLQYVLVFYSPNSHGKYSYHLIFNNILFVHKYDLTVFMKEVKESFITMHSKFGIQNMDEDDILQHLETHDLMKNLFDFIDPEVYKGKNSHQTLRMFNNEKHIQGNNKIQFYKSFPVKYKGLHYTNSMDIEKQMYYIYYYGLITIFDKNFLIQNNKETLVIQYKNIPKIVFKNQQKEFDYIDYNITCAELLFKLQVIHRLNESYCADTNQWKLIGRCLYNQIYNTYRAKEQQIKFLQESNQIDEQFYKDFQTETQKKEFEQEEQISDNFKQKVRQCYFEVFDQWSRNANDKYGGTQELFDSYDKQKNSAFQISVGYIHNIYKKEFEKLGQILLDQNGKPIYNTKQRAIKEEEKLFKKKKLLSIDCKDIYTRYQDVTFGFKQIRTLEIKEEIQLIKVNERKLRQELYEENDFYCDQEGENKHKFVLIQSQKSTGKTSNLISFLMKYKNNNTVLFVTSKVSLSSKLYGDTKAEGFQYYQQLDKAITEPMVICQINSLHRVQKDYSVLIIDEIKDFCNYICSGHFQEHSKKNCIANFESFVIKSLRVYLLDADVDSSVLFFFRNIVSRHNYMRREQYEGDSLLSYHMDYNLSQDESNKKAKVFINEYKTYCQEKYSVSFLEEKPFVYKIIKTVYTGKKIVIACLSIKYAQELYDYLVKLRSDKEIKVRLYSSESDKYVKEQELENVNQYWKTHDVIIYTPSVSIGISFDELNYFDHIFVYLCDKSTNPLSAAQMFHRVRHPKSKKILCYYNYNNIQFEKIDYSLPFIQDQLIFQKIQDNGYKWNGIDQEQYNKYNQILPHQEYDQIKDELEIMKQKTIRALTGPIYFLQRNFLKEQMFNNNFFLNVLIGYLQYCQYTIVYDNTTNYEDQYVLKLANEYIQQIKEGTSESNDQKIRNTCNVLYYFKEQLSIIYNIQNKQQETMSYLQKVIDPLEEGKYILARSQIIPDIETGEQIKQIKYIDSLEQDSQLFTKAQSKTKKMVQYNYQHDDSLIQLQQYNYIHNKVNAVNDLYDTLVHNSQIIDFINIKQQLIETYDVLEHPKIKPLMEQYRQLSTQQEQVEETEDDCFVGVSQVLKQDSKKKIMELQKLVNEQISIYLEYDFVKKFGKRSVMQNYKFIKFLRCPGQTTEERRNNFIKKLEDEKKKIQQIDILDRLKKDNQSDLNKLQIIYEISLIINYDIHAMKIQTLTCKKEVNNQLAKYLLEKQSAIILAFGVGQIKKQGKVNTYGQIVSIFNTFLQFNCSVIETDPKNEVYSLSMNHEWCYMRFFI